VAVPAFWILGRSKFQGYVSERRARDLATDPDARAIIERIAPLVPEFARGPGRSTNPPLSRKPRSSSRTAVVKDRCSRRRRSPCSYPCR
ncbi:MAG: hypothetical protein ACOY3Y_19305, partial [Acidobacteriota bacterium]